MPTLTIGMAPNLRYQFIFIQCHTRLTTSFSLSPFSPLYNYNESQSPSYPDSTSSSFLQRITSVALHLCVETKRRPPRLSLLGPIQHFVWERTLAVHHLCSREPPTFPSPSFSCDLFSGLSLACIQAHTAHTPTCKPNRSSGQTKPLAKQCLAS